ncbi:hypothetical protein FOCC_FOCC016572 [Frankliniella occidentalis]|nr:hypothetical protein FOCC_FOCC016572 [Frankliniella occidentalis]
MGGNSSAALFSECLSHALQGLLYTRNVYAYLDDIFIAIPTLELHLEILGEVFERFREAGLYLSTKKCTFGTPVVDCLGVLVDFDSHRPNPERFGAFEPLLKVTTPRGCRRIVGYLSYFRKYLKNFATKALPLTSNGLEAVAVGLFEEIKAASLFHFDPTLKSRVESDASLEGVSGCLLQKARDGLFRPFGFFSRVTTATEKRYAPFFLEGLALCETIQRFSKLLRPIQFECVTDAQGLAQILKTRNPGPRAARFISILAEYQMTIVYRTGSQNLACDAMSRSPDPSTPTPPPYAETPELECDHMIAAVAPDATQIPQLAELQDEDEETREIKQLLESGDTSDRRSRRFKLIEGAVFLKGTPARPYLPKSLIPVVLQECHDSLLGGHFGISKTLDRLDPFFWPQKLKDATKYVQSCLECQGRKHKNIRERSLTPIISKGPNELICMDIKYCPLSKRGFKYLLVVACCFSRYAQAYPLKTLTARELIARVKEYILRFGCPRRIVTDLGSNLCSKDFVSLIHSLGTAIHYSPVAHHSTSGLAEATIKSLADRIMAYCQDDLANWDLLVPACLFSLNTSKRLSMGTSPFELLHGYSPCFPCQIAYCLPEEISKADKLVRHFDLQAKAQAQLIKSQEKVKKGYEAKRKNTTYKVGQKVMVFRRMVKRNHKFRHRYYGPYEITKKAGASSYEVKVPFHNSWRNTKYHITSLRPYVKRPRRLRPLVKATPVLEAV